MNLTKQFFKYVSQNIFGLIGTSCYILADTYFIAQAAGTDGVTLLNLCLPMYNLIFAFGSMIGLGAATRYAILQAQGDERRAKRFFSNAILCACLIAIPFMLAGAFCPGTLLRLDGRRCGHCGAGPELHPHLPAVHALLHVQLHLLGLRPQRRRPVPCHGGHPERQPVQCGVRLHLHLPHGAGPARRGAGNGHLAGASASPSAAATFFKRATRSPLSGRPPRPGCWCRAASLVSPVLSGSFPLP